MSIGTRIKEAREREGLTQEMLAEKLGISKGAIGNYETGVSNPKTEILFKLIEALKVDANFIFQDEMLSMLDIKKAPTAVDAARAIKTLFFFKLGREPTLEEAQAFERSINFFCDEIKHISK